MLIAILLCCLWAIPAFAVTYGVVHGGWLRLRSDPSYSAAVITSYRNGTVVTVLSLENGWARVLTSDYRIGYMDARYLSIGSTPEQAGTAVPVSPASQAPQATIAPTAAPMTRNWTEVNRTAHVISANGKGVRMRSAPAVTKTNVIGLYPVGRTALELRVSVDGWSYIKIDNKYGYMMSKYLSHDGGNPANPSNANPTAVIQPNTVPTNNTKIQPGTALPTPIGAVTATPPFAAATATPTPVPTATPTPVPTATPTPSKQITQARLDPYKPRVGDTLQVVVTPADAEYTTVWYRDDNTLLSTNLTYKVQAADEGHNIKVRIQGVGASAGYVADAATTKVQAQPDP